MSTNSKTPATPDQNLSNGELPADLARRRAAAIAQRIAAFKQVAGPPPGNPAPKADSIPAGILPPQDLPNPEMPELEPSEWDGAKRGLSSQDVPAGEALADLSNPDVTTVQPADIVPPRSRLLDPAASQSSAAPAGERVAQPSPQLSESGYTAGYAPNSARGDRHPFVHAYAISQAARRRQAEEPAADSTVHARPFARRVPDERSHERPRAEGPSRPDVGEIRRHALYGSEFSALMRAKDAARAEAAWARADAEQAGAAPGAARGEAEKIAATRTEAARADAARLDAAPRDEAPRYDTRHDEAVAEEARSHAPRLDETGADETWAKEARSDEHPAGETWTEPAWPDDASSDEPPREPAEWVPIAAATHIPARRWPRRVAGLVGVVAITAAAVGVAFIWQLRSGDPGSQPPILAASEHAADQLAQLLTPAPQPDVPSETVLVAGEAGSAPELAASSDSPATEPAPGSPSAATLPPADEAPANETSVTEAPASPPSESAPSESPAPVSPTVARAPSANHPPATRPGASRPATTLSQLPESEAIGAAPIVSPPMPDASEPAMAPQPVSSAEVPNITAALKPMASADDAADPAAFSEPIARPAAKPLSKPAKPAAKPAKASKTPEPIKEVLDLLAPMMNGSKPQPPTTGNRK